MGSSGGSTNWRLRSDRRLTDRSQSDACSYRRASTRGARFRGIPLGCGHALPLVGPLVVSELPFSREIRVCVTKIMRCLVADTGVLRARETEYACRKPSRNFARRSASNLGGRFAATGGDSFDFAPLPSASPIHRYGARRSPRTAFRPVICAAAEVNEVHHGENIMDSRCFVHAAPEFLP